MDAIIDVVVTPNASQGRIMPFSQFPLRVRLKSSPREGRANNELIKILSRKLSVPQRNFDIIAGKTSRRKRIKITGIDVKTVEARLCAQTNRDTKARENTE
ncbi:MAG: DUF167 domain-containing protein [Puniceicoccales bacterium]|jgi:uncharacterized protein (TIGR00251 family)|nr:DUF167 domain-containing protein [Puniceicoccales bacterium]